MRKYVFGDNRADGSHAVWVRVPVQVARREMEAAAADWVEYGKAGCAEAVSVVVCGCNMRPFGGPYAAGMECAAVQLAEYARDYTGGKIPGAFDRLMAHYSFYACDSERGQYLAYYMRADRTAPGAEWRPRLLYTGRKADRK